MKTINKDELFDNLHSFLKSKGVELHEGSYKTGVHTACSLLADAVNLGQQGLERARVEVDKSLEKMRQYIHEQTAPRPANPSASEKSGSKARAAKSKKSAARAKSQKKATRR